MDPSGYDAIADDFIRIRDRRIGAATVREWCELLPRGASVLDAGCGFGEPITQVLIEAGFDVYCVDASSKMIAALLERFPQVHAECALIEDSTLFGREFDGVLLWGVMFLLPGNVQADVLKRAAEVLKPGGRLLFTAPELELAWPDAMTDRPSVSLGREEYQRILQSHGLALTAEHDDEGDNHYYSAVKT